MTALTAAQRKALLWLPADGSEKESRSGNYGALVDLVDMGLAAEGEQPLHVFFRLTPAGIALRATLAAETEAAHG